MIYGKLTEDNLEKVREGIDRFLEVGSSKSLGYRVGGAVKIHCSIHEQQITDIDLSLFLGDRSNSGRFALAQTSGNIAFIGRKIGISTKESVYGRSLSIALSDSVGFAPDNSSLLSVDKDLASVNILVKLRLRDIYALRLNNITERIANCLAPLDSIMLGIDTKWVWTRKLLCLASLECLLRALGLWESDVRDEYRNEAVIKLMLSDILFDSTTSDGLDEYNLYSDDAEQRLKDSELLSACGSWLLNGGTEIAKGLRATDLSEKHLSAWKETLESELGIILPPLTKQGEMRRKYTAAVFQL